MDDDTSRAEGDDGTRPSREALDPDDLSRREVVRTLAWRALAWLVPLIALGVLLVGLGLPPLIIIPVLGVAWLVVVLELD